MFKGSMVALISPMKPDLSLDWEALHKLIEWHIEQGTKAIVAVGTTGESATLNVKEHVEVVSKVVAQLAGRIPVIAGTGANSTSEAIELTQGALDIGADACLLVSPYYNKPSQEGLYQHHKAIAEAVDIPQILYNVPGRTSVDMLPETVIRLSQIDNIIGIKEATGCMQRLQDIRAGVSDDFLLLSGDDASALEFMRLGGCGEISVTANVVPAQTAKMCELMLAGQVEEARAIDEYIQSLHQALFLESNPIPVKWALARMEMCTDAIRLPLTQLSEQYHQPLLDAMKSVEVL